MFYSKTRLKSSQGKKGFPIKARGCRLGGFCSVPWSPLMFLANLLVFWSGVKRSLFLTAVENWSDRAGMPRWVSNRRRTEARGKVCETPYL